MSKLGIEPWLLTIPSNVFAITLQDGAKAKHFAHLAIGKAAIAAFYGIML